MRNAETPRFKTCPFCGGEFARPERISTRQWADRVHCSYRCAKSLSVSERLAKHSRLVDGPLDTPCRIWTGPTHHGYGRLIVKRDGARVHWRAHRLSFREATGIDPGGLSVCHRCDTPLCINPAHLFLGTAKDNADDRESKGRGRPIAGSARTDAKLTETAVEEIRAGGRVADLAAKYNVSISTIYKARQARSWRAVDA